MAILAGAAVVLSIVGAAFCRGYLVIGDGAARALVLLHTEFAENGEDWDDLGDCWQPRF